MGHDHQMARRRVNATINEQQVAVMHAPGLKAMAPHPHEEGGEGAGDQQAVQIETLGGGTAAVGDGQGKGERTELWRGHGIIKEYTCSTADGAGARRREQQARLGQGPCPQTQLRPSRRQEEVL